MAKSTRTVLTGAGVVLAGAAFLGATGLLATGLRLLAAGLPVGHGLFVVPFWHSILVAVAARCAVRHWTKLCDRR